MAREKRESRWNWRPWLMAAAGAALFVSTGFAAFKAREFSLRDPQFQLDPEKPGALAVGGLQYASRARVMRVFEADFGRSVFAVSLPERRRRLMAIDWVEEATVSRLWPDRLVVRLTERKPVAFVNLAVAAGVTRVLLIDANGLFLEPPPQAQFSFPVLSGITDAQSEAERRARVKAMLRLAGELGPAAGEISEINAADPENLRIVTQVEGRPVELMIGDGNYGRRYRAFLAHYPEIRKRSEATVTFDLRLDDRITARD
jgi:cell division protein FtsQ